MPRRACDSCGQEYEAKRPQSRFCCATCRKRASRGVVQVVSLAGPQPVTRPGFAAATERELREADRLDTSLGQGLLLLARLIEAGGTPAAVATMMKEWRATRDAALEGAKTAADPLDELRARRDRKLGTA